MLSATRKGGGDEFGQVESLVMSLDVGTTTVRAVVYDSKARVCGSSRKQIFNKSSWLLYLATRSTRFLAASVLRFMNSQLRAEAEAGDVMFGTLDTWLLWKLTGEQVFATDYSCASSTAMYDLFQVADQQGSMFGLYPLIGWKIGPEVVYVAEGNGGDCGQMIEWAKSLDSDGVSFVSAFSGLQAPVTDDKAATLLIGLTRSTSKSHVVRAILESLAFRLKFLFDTMCKESPVSLSKLLRCDGGVSHNDFVMQLFCDLTDRQLERSADVDTTSLGVAFLAGLQAGVWSDMAQLTKLRGSFKSFIPCQATREHYEGMIMNWQRAVKRCRSWYI
ncbi:hypothetical protein NP493_878g00006 [Ridgeia piscesae]|uniref:Carbohydrate kinase FGGY C-terminal domain-containing protein n=1 Tax=Ridgeia piscesae TaxID=27915 RepID=A0AAD9KLK6_RIDPI|nr:hypothetical protein NP493_878g00006 [Ridgeia piscesae]